MTTKAKITAIVIYLNDGRNYAYTVPTLDKAIEHASEIMRDGYRHRFEETGDIEFYPPHRILKIKIPAETDLNKLSKKQITNEPRE